MARAMQLIGFAAVASADTGPSARQLRGDSANATSLALGSGSAGTYCGTFWDQNNNDGSNYRGPVSNTDPDSCKDMCSNAGQGSYDPNTCVGWTVTNNNECYLKSSVGNMRYDEGVQKSGYCYPNCEGEQVGFNNHGHNYAGPDHVENREFCKVRCQGDQPRCKGWTVTNDGSCYLKDSVGPMESDSGVQASGFCN